MKQQTLHYITLHVPVGTDDNTRTIHTHSVYHRWSARYLYSDGG